MDGNAWALMDRHAPTVVTWQEPAESQGSSALPRVVSPNLFLSLNDLLTCHGPSILLLCHPPLLATLLQSAEGSSSVFFAGNCVHVCHPASILPLTSFTGFAFLQVTVAGL